MAFASHGGLDAAHSSISIGNNEIEIDQNILY